MEGGKEDDNGERQRTHSHWMGIFTGCSYTELVILIKWYSDIK